MSRYTVRVRQADSLHGTFACDSVYVDGGGDLHVNRNQWPGDDLITIARFQHGHWSSYELEPSAEAEAEEQLRLGAITLHEFARRILGEPDADDSTDAPVKAEALPEVGETVHVWRESGKIAGCVLMQVTGHCATESGTALALEGVLPWSPEFRQLLTSVHDETRTGHASWHWPCDGGNHAAEPAPDAPVSVTFNFDTPVLNERWLRESVDRALRQATATAAWIPYH